MSAIDKPVEVLVEAAKRGANEIARLFTKPDDDWQMVALMIDGASQFVPIVGLGSTDDSSARAHALAKAIRLREARAVVVVSSVADQPDRGGAVIITAMTPASVRSWRAVIARDGVHPPTLAPFEPWDEDGWAGSLAEVPQQALRDVASHRRDN